MIFPTIAMAILAILDSASGRCFSSHGQVPMMKQNAMQLMAGLLTWLVVTGT